MPEETHAQHEDDDDWLQEIQLDEGNRWKANKATTVGILNMAHLIESGSFTTVADYQELAAALNSEKNTIIEQCSMKGASHDNLHIYIQPLLQKIAALQEVESVEDGESYTRRILQHLRMYHLYFA